MDHKSRKVVMWLDGHLSPDLLLLAGKVCVFPPFTPATNNHPWTPIGLQVSVREELQQISESRGWYVQPGRPVDEDRPRAASLAPELPLEARLPQHFPSLFPTQMPFGNCCYTWEMSATFDWTPIHRTAANLILAHPFPSFALDPNPVTVRRAREYCYTVVCTQAPKKMLC